ncbi:GOLPH3/VPS74 family protein [Halostreptopolyspora alba]|uniref:GPP34 family phosphoprotein n=1 Tax=Halostreptopolyspora alba TaxID=2487137 RepID=A0A3N0DYB1_9ACTN|nr:GPP34 family phosphoprotein [Nocardiopsaceae bacterium YIM 96095]
MHQPTIAHELLVLCHAPETGRPLVDGTHMACGVAGAMVADLALGGHVSIDDDRVTASRRAATGDSQLDALLDRVAEQKRPRKVKWWVDKTQSSELRATALRSAVNAGLLRHEQGRVLGIFPRNDYYPADPQRREDLRQRMAATLWGRGDHGDHRVVALLALCGALGIDAKLFPETPGKQRRRMMKQVTHNDQISRAVALVIQSVQAATSGAVAAGGGGDGGGGGGG